VRTTDRIGGAEVVIELPLTWTPEPEPDQGLGRLDRGYPRFGRVGVRASACKSFWKWFMSRVCQLTGKRANNGMAVSHSHVRTKKLQQVNLQERRLWWAEGNRFIKLRVSTRALKTIQKKGLGAYAKELGVNLAKI